MKQLIVITCVAAVVVIAVVYFWKSPTSDMENYTFTSDVFTFYCSDDFTFTMQYSSDKEYAQLRLSGVEHILSRAPSGSGARYVGIDNDAEFWEHQDEVRLQLPGMSDATTCSRTPQKEDSETSEEPGISNDLIVVTSPRVGEQVANPIELKGMARGYWFFEASAPVVVTNWDGLIIGEGIITADGEWMTEDFVPFTGTLSYELPANSYSATGTLIFKKDNPSGLPENDEAYEMSIILTE